MAITFRTGLAFYLVSCLFLFLSTLPETEGQVTESNVFKDCWDAWSRCSRWSIWGSGPVWDTCTEKCRDLGHSGGNCVRVKSKCPLSEYAYQCQCF